MPKLRPKRLDGTGPKAIMLPSLSFDASRPSGKRLGLNPFLVEPASSGGQINPGFILVRRSHVGLGTSVGYGSLSVSGFCRTSSTGQRL